MRPNLFARRDERGSILILSTVGVVVAIISAALAVDLGRLAQEKRFDQKVADLAALDASRDLTRACAIAKESAARNNFDPAELDCIDPAHNPAKDVVIGRMVGGSFTPDPLGDTVQVKVSSPFKAAFPFVAGPDGVSVKAAAGVKPVAGFSLGSGLMSFDTNRATLINNVIGQMLCSPLCATASAGLSVASWQGLANGKISLETLQTALANSGFSVGSVDQLLGADMTLAQLYTATANALRTGGDTANANVFDVLALRATSSAQIELGRLLKVQQGAESAALGSSINLFQLVTGTAEVANGSRTIEVSNAGVTVPGVTSTRATLTVIEPPVIFFGAFGDPAVTTAQVDLTVTPTLNVTVPLLATITGPLPIVMAGGSATGALAAPPFCPSTGSKSFQVSVTAEGGSVEQDAALNVDLLSTPLTSTDGLLNVTGDVTVSPSGPALSPPFLEQGTSPQSFDPNTWHHGGTSLGLGTALSGSSGSALINGVLDTLVGALRPVLDDVDELIVQPLLTGLGLDLGTADVLPLTVVCGQPGLLA